MPYIITAKTEDTATTAAGETAYAVTDAKGIIWLHSLSGPGGHIKRLFKREEATRFDNEFVAQAVCDKIADRFDGLDAWVHSFKVERVPA